MRKDKDFIFTLRKGGDSYRQIQAKTGVSRATLTKWFGNTEWSKELKVVHTDIETRSSKERMIRLNMVRKLKLQYAYALIESEAVKEYELYKKEPLFWAGLMLYAGEGEKTSKGLIRISSSETYIHRIFGDFAQKYLAVGEKSLKYGLLVHEGQDEGVCKSKWAQELSLDDGDFYKTQTLRGRETRLQYGVCMSIISNTGLKRKVLKWLSLAQNEKF